MEKRALAEWFPTWTDTDLFLLPIFKLDNEALKQNGYVNAFIGDVNRNDESESPLIYMLFHPENQEQLGIFIEGLEERNIVYTDYDYEGDHVVVVLLFPTEYIEDYYKIIESNYSTCSKEYQKELNIPHFKDEHGALFVDDRGKPVGIDNLPTTIFKNSIDLKQVFADDFGMEVEELDGVEIWRKFDVDRNTLNIEDYLK